MQIEKPKKEINKRNIQIDRAQIDSFYLSQSDHIKQLPSQQITIRWNIYVSTSLVKKMH